MKKADKAIRVNLGSGVHLVKGFINVDKYFTLEDLKTKKGEFVNAIIEPGSEFLQADATNLPFKKDSVDYIESIDMIEHIPTGHVLKVFSEIYRVLKPGGKVSLMTTNFDNLAELWLSGMKKPDFTPEIYFELCELIYGNQAGPGEVHMTPFNPSVMNSLIVSVGLKMDRMTIFPQGNNDYPNDMYTQKWGKNTICRSDMMWVRAHKPAKKQNSK